MLAPLRGLGETIVQDLHGLFDHIIDDLLGGPPPVQKPRGLARGGYQYLVELLLVLM